MCEALEDSARLRRSTDEMILALRLPWLMLLRLLKLGELTAYWGAESTDFWLERAAEESDDRDDDMMTMRCTKNDQSTGKQSKQDMWRNLSLPYWESLLIMMWRFFLTPGLFPPLSVAFMEKIKRKTDDQVKKEPGRARAQAEYRPPEVECLNKETQDVVTEITSLNGNLEQKKSTLLKADSFYHAFFFTRRPAIQSFQTSCSGESCRLQTQIQAQSLDQRFGVTWPINSQGHWKPGRSRCSSRSRHQLRVTSRKLKDVITTTGWNSSQKYEALSGEKVTDTVKETLALQNVRGNLAQSLSFSVGDSTRSPSRHQRRLSVDKERRSAPSRRAKAKVKNQKDLENEKGQKAPRVIFRIRRGSQKVKARPSQKGKVNGPSGPGIRVKVRITAPQVKVIKRVTKTKIEKGGRSSRLDDQAHQCWWNQGPQQGHGQQGSSQNQSQSSRQVYNISKFLRINQFRQVWGDLVLAIKIFRIEVCDSGVFTNHAAFQLEVEVTVGPTIITLHEFIVPGLIIELHYICSVCLN